MCRILDLWFHLRSSVVALWTKAMPKKSMLIPSRAKSDLRPSQSCSISHQSPDHLAIRSECSVSKYLTMNGFERFKRFSTGVGLLVLAVGFSSLGFLSLINRHPEDAATGFFSEATYLIIGSSISILVGATFLVAAILFAGTLLREKRPFAPGWRKDRRRDPAFRR